MRSARLRRRRCWVLALVAALGLAGWAANPAQAGGYGSTFSYTNRGRTYYHSWYLDRGAYQQQFYYGPSYRPYYPSYGGGYRYR